MAIKKTKKKDIEIVYWYVNFVNPIKCMGNGTVDVIAPKWMMNKFNLVSAYLQLQFILV